MPERTSKKKPRDINQLAASIVDEATRDEPDVVPMQPEKNPAAVALGRLGGLKGGKARAEKLTPEKRSEIAKKAAAKRWGGGAMKLRPVNLND
ncbi:MAG: hypothetical protein DLM70_13465 [Chloroflexi bacterium]|nr:MAG: hypothetical protein DLM70_13465 [Chloroflexota bacterium]